MSKPYIGAILVTIALLLFLPWINRPFTGHHDFTGAFDSIMARNYLRYGLIQTKLGQVTNFGGDTKPEGFSYHTHHPPGIPLLLAGVYQIFGEQEWAARSAMAVFALGSVFLFFTLVAEATSVTIGICATLILITTPLFIYPSILPVYEAPALFLILLQCYSFSRFSKTGKNSYLTLLVVAAILGYITAWVTYFTIPTLLASEILLRRTKHLRLLSLLFITSFLFFSLHVLHTRILTGQWLGGGLDQVFLKRIGATPEIDERYVFSTGKYLATISKRIKDFCGLPIGLAALLGIVVIVTQRKETARHLFITLAGMALALPIFFRNYIFVHDYVLYYTVPLLSFTAAIGLHTCWYYISKSARGMLFLTVAVILLNTLFTKTTWKDLWESKYWYEASKIIGTRLRATTQPRQLILIANFKLTEQEMQLQYYADRSITFPVKGVSNKENPLDPDVIVTVTSELQFPPEVKERLLTEYHLETDHGVEYYYRK